MLLNLLPPQRGVCNAFRKSQTPRKFAACHSGACRHHEAFAFYHSEKRVVALIAAVFWHLGSTRASKSASRGPQHFVQEPAQRSRQTGAKVRTRALAQKPGMDHDFLGKFGADLCRPEHKLRIFPAEHGFLGKTCDFKRPQYMLNLHKEVVAQTRRNWFDI